MEMVRQYMQEGRDAFSPPGCSSSFASESTKKTRQKQSLHGLEQPKEGYGAQSMEESLLSSSLGTIARMMGALAPCGEDFKL
ncbi:unnamed protein product [Ranitomeya imitator]|uniref:Uncharacterized protein n=1 Tax=Ranitomeya imitator TaxID=111125 RepID=A0ABN9M977_9NEOB|nr:unnamed protein product [Ranitomeya imitator]